VVVHGSVAYVVDRVRGEIRRVDPQTLAALGPVVNFSPGLRGGAFDDDGRLWLALPGEGTAVALTAGRAEAAPEVTTRPVAPPNHDLVVSVLDKGVAVLDQTNGQLAVVRGDTVTRTPLTLTGPATMPERTRGDRIAVTLPGPRQVLVVNLSGNPADGGAVTSFDAPGEAGTVSAAVPWGGRFYLPDERAGVVYVLDAAGILVDQIRLPGGSGRIELEGRGDYLFVNSVDTGQAWIIDKDHKVSAVDKYPDKVVGGDPAPNPPPPPDPPQPEQGPPGAPTNVVAWAGDARARVSWGPAPANGSPIERYVIEGGPQRLEVGADRRSVEVDGLTNGTAYTFSVSAVNGRGAGPKRSAPPVVPTSAVPEPPATVTARERPDGTVQVGWSTGDAKGGKVAGYQVTANGPGGPVQTWQVDGGQTELATPAGALAYGQQYAFTVVTVNEQGAGSKASALSNSVAPYTVPGVPGSLKVTTGSGAGTLKVSWTAPAGNGRPITKYVVAYNGKSQDVTGRTSVDLTGLPAGTTVAVTVTAVNAAGPGRAAGPASARTIAAPTVTITGSTVGYNRVTVSFTVNDGGGNATCRLAVTGASTVQGKCTSITVGGLTPGVRYAFTVTATNEAGSGKATGSATTTALLGTVRCVSTNGYCDPGIAIYDSPSQKTGTFLADAKNGKRFQAYCKAKGDDELYAYIYNNEKTSIMWVKIAESDRYIPWIWFNLDGGDKLSLLPTC
jgi:hypothetical protein